MLIVLLTNILAVRAHGPRAEIVILLIVQLDTDDFAFDFCRINSSIQQRLRRGIGDWPAKCPSVVWLGIGSPQMSRCGCRPCRRRRARGSIKHRMDFYGGRDRSPSPSAASRPRTAGSPLKDCADTPSRSQCRAASIKFASPRIQLSSPITSAKPMTESAALPNPSWESAHG